MKLRLFVLLGAFALLVTACGGSGDAADGVATLESPDGEMLLQDATPGVVEDVDAEEAMMALAACLREQGLDIEDPTVDADGNVQFGAFRGGGEDGEPVADREEMRAAMEVCQTELDGVALGFGGRQDLDQTEMQDTMLEWAACMRDNGYDVADPDLSSLGGEPGAGDGGGGPFADIDPDDPDFIAAQEACGDIFGGLPVPGAGGRRPGVDNG